MGQRRAVAVHARILNRDRLDSPAESPHRQIDLTPAPNLTREQMARQLAADPEFVAAFGREPRNPW